MDDKWVRNVRQSPASTEAAELLHVLNEASAPDENTASDLGRARREAERAGWILGNCDPYLMPQASLDQTHAALVQATAHARTFHSTQDPSSLANVMAFSDQALIHLSAASIPGESAAPAEQLAGLAQVVSEQREAAGAEMAALVESLRLRVAGADQERAAAEAQVSELQLRLEQLRAEVDALRQGTSVLTTQWQTAFTDEQSTRAEQFRALLDDQRTQGDSTKSSLELAVRKAVTAAETDVAQALSAIESKKEQAEQIVGIISDTALIGEPSKRAEVDKRLAFGWSMASVALGVVAVVIAVVALFVHTQKDSDWIGFALKALAVVAVGGVSTYAARQAHEHRVAQREQEHLAVQLAAIKPFLRDMDPKLRDEVLKDVSSRLFGQPMSSKVDAVEEAVLPPGTMQVIQLLVAAARGKS